MNDEKPTDEAVIEWSAEGPPHTGVLDEAQVRKLLENLNPERVHTRSTPGGGNRQMSYLAAYEVKAALIRVFGFAGFSADCIDAQVLKVTEKEMPPRNNRDAYVQYTVLAQATVRLTIHATGATYTETAASSQVNNQVGEAADFAIKTAESDALKRAATYLGTQFGLSLYDDGSTRDVVGVVLAPGQKEVSDKVREERRAATQTARDAVSASLKQREKP